jgi:hypothetical protein
MLVLAIKGVRLRKPHRRTVSSSGLKVRTVFAMMSEKQRQAQIDSLRASTIAAGNKRCATLWNSEIEVCGVGGSGGIWRDADWLYASMRLTSCVKGKGSADGRGRSCRVASAPCSNKKARDPKTAGCVSQLVS